MARATNTRFAVAVHVLTYLAGLPDGVPASSDRLSGSTNSNPVYIRRVMGPLREAGFVRSRPGAHGGWELTQPATAISLAAVWRVLQGTEPVLGLHGSDPACTVGRTVQTALLDVDQRVADAVERELASISVADVVSGRSVVR